MVPISVNYSYDPSVSVSCTAKAQGIFPMSKTSADLHVCNYMTTEQSIFTLNQGCRFNEDSKLTLETRTLSFLPTGPPAMTFNLNDTNVSKMLKAGLGSVHVVGKIELTFVPSRIKVSYLYVRDLAGFCESMCKHLNEDELTTLVLEPSDEPDINVLEAYHILHNQDLARVLRRIEVLDCDSRTIELLIQCEVDLSSLRVLLIRGNLETRLLNRLHKLDYLSIRGDWNLGSIPPVKEVAVRLDSLQDQHKLYVLEAETIHTTIPYISLHSYFYMSLFQRCTKQIELNMMEPDHSHIAYSLTLLLER